MNAYWYSSSQGITFAVIPYIIHLRKDNQKFAKIKIQYIHHESVGSFFYQPSCNLIQNVRHRCRIYKTWRHRFPAKYGLLLTVNKMLLNGLVFYRFVCFQFSTHHKFVVRKSNRLIEVQAHIQLVQIRQKFKSSEFPALFPRD